MSEKIDWKAMLREALEEGYWDDKPFRYKDPNEEDELEEFESMLDKSISLDDMDIEKQEENRLRDLIRATAQEYFLRASELKGEDPSLQAYYNYLKGKQEFHELVHGKSKEQEEAEEEAMVNAMADSMKPQIRKALQQRKKKRPTKKPPKQRLKKK